MNELLEALRSPTVVPEKMTGETQPLVVIDRRPLIGTSICCWIDTLGCGVDPILIAGIDCPGSRNVLDRARGALWATSAPVPWKDEWLSNGIIDTLTRYPEMPIVLVADTPDAQVAEETATQLHLSGYIPSTSSLELAATALRLVLAGGKYLPRIGFDTGGVAPSAASAPSASSGNARLTMRERAVLDLLERGLPNKLIAYRLGMSQSTVKAHVHNIIAKLNVRNRTEAAMARYMGRVGFS